MSVSKKPVVALFGLLAALAMSLFFSAGSASAVDGYGNETVAITATSSPNADGSTTYSVAASGFKPGEDVIVYVHSAPVELGSTTASSTGSISTSVTVPASYTGSHTLEAVGQTSGVTASFPIQLGGSGSASGSGSGGLSSTGVAVVGIGALGVVLLAGGGLMLFAGKRRKSIA